ncbi:MAG: sulfatase-like hydrolase/transferase [Rhabdochlamydiaceae bacterium]|nr:sulfatase-like hydrolase/transferase [Rhabdochlamydiaceae bacterium]
MDEETRNSLPGPATPPARHAFNYLFFGAYFLIIAFLHVFHVFLVEPSWTFTRYFFIVFALGESVLETAILILLGRLVRQYLSRAWDHAFVALAFIMLLTHLIDFPLVRLMGISFWFALHFVSQESYSNFIELLLASNVSLFAWAALGLAGVGVILGGVFLYRLSERWTDRHPFAVKYSTLSGLLCTTALFLFVWETTTVQNTLAMHFESYEKTLPWKNTFLPVQKEYLVLDNALKEPEEEQDALRKLDSRAFSLSRRPDIYLFVIESLREDFITSEVTPQLHQFKTENIHFDLALSNANATQISWFSIFFSKFPFYFGKIVPDQWTGGCIPLRLLKKMGYKIHVYSSARLGYYQMDHLILGESRYLADKYYSLEDSEIQEVYQRDESAIDQLIDEMGNGSSSSGRVFLVFLDATHHDYSWPLETGSHFHPFEETVNYFKAAVSNAGLEGIRNRYRNALRFVDGQLGRFFEALNGYKGGEESIVMITGDHAEEFYEQGYLFHASGLSHQQTHVPLYFKFGQNDHKLTQRTLCCHMDIFPSIFHYLIGEDLFGEVFQGQSIFNAEYWPYVVTARFNASRSPYEFFIHNGSEKILARFTKEGDIFSSNQLRVLAHKTLHDEPLVLDMDSIQERFSEAIDRIFKP